MKLAAPLVVVGALFAASPAVCATPQLLTEMYGAPNADANNVTTESNVTSLFSDGRLLGCSVTFTVIHRDYAYHDGDYARLDGSVSLMYSEGKAIAGTLKLGVATIEEGKAARTAPIEAAVIGERSNSSLKELFESGETSPGFRLFVYDLTKTDQSAFLEAFSSAGEFQRFEGYYTLKKGGLGSNFYVDMRVRSFDTSTPNSLQLTSDAGERLKRCTEDLLALAIADEEGEPAGAEAAMRKAAADAAEAADAAAEAGAAAAAAAAAAK